MIENENWYIDSLEFAKSHGYTQWYIQEVDWSYWTKHSGGRKYTPTGIYIKMPNGSFQPELKPEQSDADFIMSRFFPGCIDGHHPNAKEIGSCKLGCPDCLSFYAQDRPIAFTG
jgi:hypothetical protein